MLQSFKKWLTAAPLPVQCVTICLTVVPVILFFWLAAQYFSLNGTLKFSTDFSSESSFVDPIYPRGRASDRLKNLRTGETYQEITGEPTYVPVHVPRSFQDTEITVSYTNRDNAFMEFGIVTNTDPWSIRLQPFDIPVLNEALAIWNRREGNGFTLLEKDNGATSADEFVRSIPNNKHIGVYGFELTVPYSLQNYAASKNITTIQRLLRGTHEFMVYAANEDVHLEFDVRDINREFNADAVSLQVFRNNDLIHEQSLTDDGVVDASAAVSPVRTISTTVPIVDAGVYRILFATTNDMVIQEIRSAQEKLIVKNRLFVVNNVEYVTAFGSDMDTSSTQLFFGGGALTARTDHPSSLQNIGIDQASLSLQTVHSPHTWYPATRVEADQVHRVLLPANDVELLANGYFAFSDASYFDPDYFVEPITEDSAVENLDYILFTGYEPPIQEPRSSVQTARVSLDGVAGDRKDLTFVFSIPGIAQKEQTVQIQEMQFEFRREPLLKRLTKRFFE